MINFGPRIQKSLKHPGFFSFNCMVSLLPGEWRTNSQKYSSLRCLLHFKGLVICLYLGRSGSIFSSDKMGSKVGSKSWLLTCSGNITLSLPSVLHTMVLLWKESWIFVTAILVPMMFYLVKFVAIYDQGNKLF